MKVKQLIKTNLEIFGSARISYYLWHLKHNILRQNTLHHVTLMLTNRCDYSCPMCECDGGKAYDNELKTYEIINLLNEMKQIGVLSVTLIGGEILLRADIFDIISHCNSLKFFVELATNASQVEKHLDKFKKVKINSLLTSIDGLSKTNNVFRGHFKAFEKSIESIKFFKARGAYPILVNTVVHPGNIEELEELGLQLQDAEVDLWRLTPIFSVGRARNTFNLELNEEQLINLLQFIKTNRYRFHTILSEEIGYVPHFHQWFYNRHYYYDAGLNSCAINPEGFVLGDLTLYESKYFEGNIRQTSLEKIWQEKFISYRKPKLLEKCDQCPYLIPCNGGSMSIRDKKRDCLDWLFPVLENF